MFPLYRMSPEEKGRFAYDPETPPTGQELDNYPEIKDSETWSMNEDMGGQYGWHSNKETI